MKAELDSIMIYIYLSGVWMALTLCLYDFPAQCNIKHTFSYSNLSHTQTHPISVCTRACINAPSNTNIFFVLSSHLDWTFPLWVAQFFLLVFLLFHVIWSQLLREWASAVRDCWCPDSESPRCSSSSGGGILATTASSHMMEGGGVATGGF